MSHHPKTDNFRRQRAETDRYVITDPEAQPELTAIIPQGEIPVAYLNRYVAEHDVACAFCGRHQLHRKGFTAQMADGRKALCGIDCGRRYFGDHAALRLEQELAVAEQERLDEELIAQAIAGLPEVIEALTKLWVPLERQVVEFMSWLPKIHPRATDGRMDEGIDFRLGRHETKWRRRPDGLEVPDQVFVETGRVREMRIILAQRGRLSDALTMARHIMGGQATKARDMTPEERVEMRSDLIQVLRDGIRWMAMAQIFLAPDNVERCGSAVRSVGDGTRMEVKERKGVLILRVRADEGEWNSMPIPDLSVVPTEVDLVSPLLGLLLDGAGGML